MTPPEFTVAEFVDWVRAGSGGAQNDVRTGRFVVGICGPPGAGKSTLAERLGREMGVPVVPMDGFHLPNAVLDERGLRAVKGAPHTFDAQRFVDAVHQVAEGTTDLWLPVFDRSIDEPREDGVAVPATATTVVVEGNYLALDREPWTELSSSIDVIAYVALDDDVRTTRLVARHIEFGKSPDDAVEFVRDCDESNTRLVASSRHRADVVVHLAE